MAAEDPFDLVGDDDLGAVCVHGFTGTPFEVRYLGEALARGGVTVRGIRLPGHGTTLADLDRTTWLDWACAVDAAVDALADRCKRVVVVGQSLGGLLALHTGARRRDVAAVASLAAPLWLDGLNGKVATWTRGRRWNIPKLGGSDVRDREAKRANPCYRAIPTKALGELVDFMGIVEAELPRVQPPVLVLHAQQDHTAPVACAHRIAAQVPNVQVEILPRSYHLIAVDVERDVVAAQVLTFIRRHACAT